MSIRGIDTLIAVLADRTVRVDRASGEVLSLDLDSHVSTALALSALFRTRPLKRGARVLVLSSEFFTQAVRLPELQTDGLSKDELLAALVFEVEPFSNISLAQGQAAFTAGELTAGIRTWNVLQIARSEIQALQTTVAAAGGRVAGLAFADSASLSIVPESEWAARLTDAARAAESAPPVIPVIQPTAKGLGIKGQELMAGLVFALVCCACLGHSLYAKRHVADLRERNRKLEELTAVNTQIETVNTSLKGKIAAIEKARADREAAEHAFARYRAAWRTLMRGLLDSCDNTVVIQRIEGGSLFDAQIGGLSTVEKGPGDYLARLAGRLADSGWRIQSESMQSVTSLGGQGPVRFNFHASLDLPGEVRRPNPQSATADW